MDIKLKHGGHQWHESIPLKGAHAQHTGPKAGDKDWHNEMMIDLSQIKYDAVTDKKAKDGTRVPLSIEDQFMMSQLQPATRAAKNFNVRYFTEVTTEFDGCICCCNETPDAKTAMTIVPMVNPNCYGFAPPSNWAPYPFGTKVYGTLQMHH